jgi:hypothetical protein
MRVFCPDCGGGFTCIQCGFPLRKVEEPAQPVVSSAVTFKTEEVKEYVTAFAARSSYTTGFERGPRGGAMIDFGDLIKLECYLPYVDRASGELLPFMPMPLSGEKVHDLSKSDRRACEQGLCSCERPTGWQLTRPILRAMLGVSDSFLNEHASELPGRLPGWRVTVDTPTFMRECYFEREFQFPTREASRRARRARRGSKRWSSRPLFPNRRDPRRR